MAGNDVAGLIPVADLARRLGRHHSNVRRWLRDLDRKHGGGIALRVGKGPNARLYTTTAALARVAPHLVEPTSTVLEQVSVMQRDIDTLFERTARLLEHVRELANRVAAPDRRRA